jgi:hypothetical protein
LSENIQMIMILGTPTYAKTAHPFHLHHWWWKNGLVPV